jgi:hypothetical protein
VLHLLLQDFSYRRSYHHHGSVHCYKRRLLAKCVTPGEGTYNREVKRKESNSLGKVRGNMIVNLFSDIRPQSGESSECYNAVSEA